ncbi:MORN repeat protein [Ichthyophthirius multifiliis]|uniref:MORN repeat protein n=1 Tax=Ichthyophthirius multifiliis TaxID=5932 RepID=G0QS46_ICHMU|nr:MORN repeat protein [Ichthyophthirius multifiliis]EGR31959.1 MORN repeat protein [Ichthyophthirius multifiliis]|eukprot:XP_004035445.1 MORN repeat protein [Ichthyophthirius multifiliis]
MINLKKVSQDNLPILKSYIGFPIKQPPLDILNPKVKQLLSTICELNYKHKQYENSFANYYDWHKLKNNTFYKGQWKNGMKNGRGIIIWKEGSLYEGYWKNNKIAGYGRFINFKGDVYEGQFLDQDTTQAFSFGVLSQYQSNSLASVSILNSVNSEQQEINLQNESSDQFEFHGKGIYKWADGSTYDGMWKNDQMQGFGTFIWPDGKKYMGQFQKNKKQGKGEIHWPDRSFCTGQFLNGKQDGEGEYTNVKGKAQIGLWKNGQLIKWIQKKTQNNNEITKQVIDQFI